MAPGNPDHFVWDAKKQLFLCKLCFKYATAEHIGSAKHKKRELYPACYMSPVVVSLLTEPSVCLPGYQAVGDLGARSLLAKAVETPLWECIGERLFKNINTQETVIKLPPGTPYFERF